MSKKTVHLAIEGMHCGGCVTRVTAALKKVESAEVEHVEVGAARVTVEETQAPALVEAVNRIGFTARES